MSDVRFTVGAHNTGDERGTPTFFADLLYFTEAIPARIEALLPEHYRMVVCSQQHDLVLAYDNRVFRRDRLHRTRYAKYVDGWAGVTPNRGTFTVPLIHLATKRKIRANVEHRINAAFPPYVRGEADFRRDMWHTHTAATLETMHRQDHAGLLVVSAGDCNTPNGVAAYRGFAETGEHFDRIGTNAELTGLDVLSKEGSDHPRVRAVVTEKEN